MKKRIAKRLHTFAKAEIILAINKYYPGEDDRNNYIKMVLLNQDWQELTKEGKKYFKKKANLIFIKK